MALTIQCLPEEILEKIFFHLSPYKDYDEVALVCKQWNRIIAGVARRYQKDFETAFETQHILWTEASIDRTIPVNTVFLSPRLFHSMCYNDHTRSVYIFGGLSVGDDSAGFNDMWRLDMHTKRWERPITDGDIPQPKYGCSLESYKNYLILYGGQSMPSASPFPVYRPRYCSDELHIFDTRDKKWTLKATIQDSPPSLVFHRTCIVTNQSDEDSCMVLFGGIKDQSQDSSEMWCLELSDFTWWKPIIVGQLPPPRHMHTQASYKSDFTFSSAVLIVGAVTVGSPILTDAWILVRSGFREWTSSKLTIQPGPNNFIPPIHVFKTSAVKIGECLVFLSGVPANNALPNKRKIYRVCPYEESNNCRREVSSKTYHNPLCMYILDISKALTDNVLTWKSSVSEADGKILKSMLGPDIPNRHVAVVARGEVVIHGDFTLATKQHIARTVRLPHNFLQTQAMNKWTPLYFISTDVT